MIDLRSPDAVLSEYAQRYAELQPEWSPQLQQRMSYTLEPGAPYQARLAERQALHVVTGPGAGPRARCTAGVGDW